MRHFRSICAFILLATFAAHVSPARAWTDVVVGTSEQSALGARFADGWLHFGVYAPDAKGMGLLLFDDPATKAPSQIIPLIKTADTWRIKIQGDEARPGLLYLFKAQGPRVVSPSDRHGDLF